MYTCCQFMLMYGKKKKKIKILWSNYPPIKINNFNNNEPGDSKEYDFKSYHIIRFKCWVFNKNITKPTKKHENMVHSKEKNKSIDIVPEKLLMAYLYR